MRLFALVLLLATICGTAAPPSVHASPPPSATPAQGCALVMATAQPADGCTWIGTITLTRTMTNSTSTPLPATPNNHGGTSTNALEEHDTTTLQLSGESLANVTRDHTVVNTMTTQSEPG